MTPIEVIHAALLHTGEVLFIAEAYSPNTLLWNPEDPVDATAFRLLDGVTTGLTRTVAGVPVTDRLACCGHSFLQDGRLLAVGGDQPTRATAWIFDPATERWSQTGTMTFGRWYPTCVTLGDDSGRILVVGGSNASNAGTAVPQMEIYNESSGMFTRVWGPGGPGDTSADRSFPKLYPGLHLTPNGEIFHTRVGDRSGTDRTAKFAFTALDRGQWTEVTDSVSDKDRTNGMSVLLLKQVVTDPDRVLAVGGGDSTTAPTISVVDVPATTTTSWLTGNFPDGVQRSLVNVVALPDGSAFICGGIAASGGAAMLYRPPVGAGLGTLTTMDTLLYPRQHHSTSLLLPSAKVIVTGGEGPNNTTIEVFSPPYLFDSFGVPLPESARPDITSFPNPDLGEIVLHGSTFTVGFTAGTPPNTVDRVVMVKPMAVTHQTDTEQRVIRLVHTVSGTNTLSVTAPDGRVYPYGVGGGHTHAIAGRGYYMLFLINTAGVPSRAKFIKLV